MIKLFNCDKSNVPISTLREALDMMIVKNIESIKNGYGGPFSAALIDTKKDFQISFIKTNEVIKNFSPSRHAEVTTIDYACNNLKTIDLSDMILFSSHMPCLMCYHAIKWASIKSVYTLFAYEETENIFGFKGDVNFLEELNIDKNFATDNKLDIFLINNKEMKDLYIKKVLPVWTDHCSKIKYDVSR